MPNLILFDDDAHDGLLPLTYTRPVAELRVGILTIREKWQLALNSDASYITQGYLSDRFPIYVGDDNLVVNGSVLPNTALLEKIQALEPSEAILSNGNLVAARLDFDQFTSLMEETEIEELAGMELEADLEFIKIDHVWEVFQKNDKALADDFALLTQGRTSAPLSSSNRLIGPVNQLFIEPGAKVEGATINTTNGPVYIGTGAEVMEGCLIRGGLALCEGAVLKMGAKIYGATTIGPYCKVGGEVTNSVLQGYTNKAHDGYLGNSVLGEWCNLGADTNCSNLKNTYEEVKLWNFNTESFEPTGQQFIGLIMGDHSKAAINTMFNTGTVVGVCANIFGEGFPRQFIPSFSWGGKHGFTTFRLDKASAMAARVMSRRNIPFLEEDQHVLQWVYDFSAKYRSWEKKAVD